MANPHRGEVEIKAGEKIFTLVYTINALCELESATDKPIDAILAEINTDKPRLAAIRALFWAGLRTHHKMTLEEAGEVMQQAGVVHAAVTAQKAVALAFPAKDDPADNPQ